MPLVIKIGADPELWVRNIKTGKFVSAHDLMPGTKLQPHKVDSGAVQVDGVAAEFNINPSLSSDEFCSNIMTVTSNLRALLGDKYDLVSVPTWEIPEDYFKSLPEHVRELGCNPDYNAWTGQVNERPDGESTFLRTAAGHVHIGWTDKVDPTNSIHFEDCRIIAKQLDYYLGMYSLMWDEDTKRRTLYGRAGSFRPKPYGMEYRPLSNVWLRSQRMQDWVWNAAYRGVIDAIQNNKILEETFGEAARECIDGNVRWWEDDSKEIKTLPMHTNLSTPPKLPKPKTPGVVEKPSLEFGTILRDRWMTGIKTSSEFNKVLKGSPPLTKAYRDGMISYDHITEQYYVPAKYVLNNKEEALF